ncbi:uncharacterized protein N7506_005731, partial [Penicillium brevicompactum]|uniref:uncharacterized protein n=1 Tax=Penicillium brevicompactum TaxID=5074 RepID=UPI00254067D6
MLRALHGASRAICFTIILVLLVLQTRNILCDRFQTMRVDREDPNHCRSKDLVDWSRFAYSQYATNTAYLCNSVMIFETLHRLNSRADRFLIYPSRFSADENDDGAESRLLRQARDEYNVKLVPTHIQRRHGGDPTWSESFTKLLAFNQTQYDRVLSLDSDVTMLQHMDELFFLPSCPLALPRAYWLDPDHRIMTSYLMLIEPSTVEFDRIVATIESSNPSDYDMEIVNTIYRDHALILPHRPYTLLTGEFRETIHTRYLGNSREVWSPQKALMEAKTVHFSDWPVPKPWVDFPSNAMNEHKPSCRLNATSGQVDDCRDRDLWLGIYHDFHIRRQ